MFKYVLLLVIPALVLAANQFEDEAKLLFTALDTDGNSKITHDELKSFFVRFDSDDDGYITREEFILAILLNAPPFVPVADALYNTFDTDADGRLVLHDLEHLLHRMDYNSNGEASEDEFVSYMSALLEQAHQ